MFDEAAYRKQFNIPADVPLANDGVAVKIMQGGFPFSCTVAAAGGGPPVPQASAGSTPQIGTGNVAPAWLFDSTGQNGIGIPVGSILTLKQWFGTQALMLTDYGLIWSD